MIKQCKKCGSENLYLEPRVKGQDVLTADMVALKCKDCGSWLKWCPKDERKYYYANTQPKQNYKDKIIKFINELAWKDVQYDAYQSTIGEFTGSTSAIPRYAKKYFDLWKEMFGEDLNKKEEL